MTPFIDTAVGTPVSTPRPKALLFDLGGVVLDIDFDRAFERWALHSPLTSEQIKKLFSFDTPYQRHERGEIEVAEYFDHLAASLQIDTDHTNIADGWNSIFIGEISETAKMVLAVRQHIPCYAFTNTNAVHMAAWTRKFPAIASSFRTIFASHQIGFRKPELQAFNHIAQVMGVAPESILFFDDLLENVEGAIAAGLQGVHVRSPQDVRNALSVIGYATT